MRPHDFWQEILPPSTFDKRPRDGHHLSFPAGFDDGRQLLLPIRELADGQHGLASLIISQASFEVEDALCRALSEKVSPYEPDVVVGVPTLGLTLACGTAKHLGHSRYVPLGTSRKFWYLDEFSVPLSSITSPDQGKRLYLDPRMLPLIENKRVLLVDDVISSGTSILAALHLLARCGITPIVIGAAMLQTQRWRSKLADAAPDWSSRVVGVLQTPLLRRTTENRWIQET